MERELLVYVIAYVIAAVALFLAQIQFMGLWSELENDFAKWRARISRAFAAAEISPPPAPANSWRREPYDG